MKPHSATSPGLAPLGPPSPWVARFLPAVPAGGRILDVACGRGRHLALGVASGYRMTGVDRDTSRIEPPLRAVCEIHDIDLEDGRAFPYAGETFACVIVTNYLWRPILPDIVSAVARDGVLIYETFALGNERFGRPANPDHLLRPGELLDAVAGRLVVIAYEHLRLDDPPRMVQRICAVGMDRLQIDLVLPAG